MTTSAVSPGYTASWLLSGGRAEAKQGLTGIMQGLAQSGILGRISDQAFGALNEQLTEATYGLLNLDLRALLQDGWRKHTLLMAAAHATITKPDAVELVELAKHSISATHLPAIDIYVNGVKLATISLELKLELEIDALLGKVRQGRLVELQVGRCTATGELLCESVRLAASRAHLDPSFAVGLGSGLALIREESPNL